VRRRALAQAGGLAGAAGIGIAVAGATLPASGGCTTHQCDASTSSILNQGELEISPDGGIAYETSPLNIPAGGGAWLAYPGEVTLAVTFPPEVRQALAQMDLEPSGDVVTYISTSSEPNMIGGAGFTQISGSLAVVTDLTCDGFSIQNQTCAPYFVRVEVGFKRSVSGACRRDAGASTPQDAAGDAVADAPTDALADASGAAPADAPADAPAER
jgi:hypothetical protein